MPHAHPSGFPSPCPGLRSNPPRSLVCRRFPQWWRARGGQAPALRLKNAAPLTVGRGPSDATRASERVSLAMPRSAQQPSVVSCLLAFSAAMERSRGTGPRATVKKRPPLTVGRGPVPRHAAVVTATLRGLWAAGVCRSDGEIAGDRPPRYDKKRFPFLVGLGPSHATRACERVSLAIVRARALQRSRGTGPRATGRNRDQEVSPTGENGIVTILTTTI